MLNVVVGVIFDQSGKVFINKRRPNTFMQSYWEFPGGKVEEGEGSYDALVRELREELAITITRASYQLDFSYHYPQQSVHLSVYLIQEYEGVIRSNEGQEICFTNISKLKEYLILPTVMPIVNRMRLSTTYHIRNYHQGIYDEFVTDISHIELLQLRSKESVPVKEVKNIYTLCKEHNTTLILNIPNLLQYEHYADGLHLTSAMLMSDIDITTTKLLSASTHSSEEILKANERGVDIITLSPIKHTITHFNATPLGYEQAAGLAKKSNSAVYLLGGMSKDDIADAKKHCAHGIAGISKLH